MKKQSKSISFRLPLDLVELLLERADRLNMSPGEMARAMVVTKLSELEPGEMTAEIQHIKATLDISHNQLKSTERKLAYHLFIILHHVGGMSAEQAKQIVKRDYLRNNEV